MKAQSVPYFFLTFVFSILLFAACDGDDDDDALSDDDATTDDDQSEDDDSAVDDDVDDDDGSFPPLDIEWGECPPYIQLDSSMVTECATVSLPLNYKQEKGETIPIFIYRVVSQAAEKKGQLWFLQGGPGGSGADYAGLFYYYIKAFPEYDFYSLDHRGVGNSSRLTCPQENYEEVFDFAGCAAHLKAVWGDDLKLFNVSNAARDVARVVDAVAEEKLPKFIYGSSYGTFWALRYLQLYPNQVDGVILDSICPPGGCWIDEYDMNFNENGQKFMATCSQDPVCSAKIATVDSDPWEAVGKMYDKIDNNEICLPLRSQVDRQILRLGLAMLEMDYFGRVLIPSAIYRLNRCNLNDILALNNLISLLYGEKGMFDADDYIEDPAMLDTSLTLGTLIIMSEMFGDSTYEELVDYAEQAYFSADAGPFLGEIHDSGLWPIYSDDGLWNQLPDTDIPILMFNGELDPQTTMVMAQPARDHFTGPHQTFVAFPYSTHGAIIYSQTPASIDGFINDTDAFVNETCGVQIFGQFIDDPLQPIDTSCLSDQYPLEFSSDSPLNQMISSMLYGTDDMWEGSVFGKRSAPKVLNADPFRRNRLYR